MKKKLTILCALLLLITTIVPAKQGFAAEPSAKTLLKTAVEYMKSSNSIGYCKDLIRTYSDKSIQYRYLCGTSDNQYEYHICVDDSQSQDGWQEYNMSGAVYRRSYKETKWTYYSDAGEFKTKKQSIESSLSNYKKASIISTSTRNYVIKVTPKTKDSNWKYAYVTINKKSGHITKVKYTLAEKTYTYLNSSSTYTVTGGTRTYYNISYGDSKIVLPDEIIK